MVASSGNLTDKVDLREKDAKHQRAISSAESSKPIRSSSTKLKKVIS